MIRRLRAYLARREAERQRANAAFEAAWQRRYATQQAERAARIAAGDPGCPQCGWGSCPYDPQCGSLAGEVR